VCGAGPCQLPGLGRDEGGPKNGVGTFQGGERGVSVTLAPCFRGWAVAGRWEQFINLRVGGGVLGGFGFVC